MINRRIQLAAALLMLALASAPHLRAQSSTSDITGTVLNVHGSPQPGALVQLLTPDSNGLWNTASAVTDGRGRYTFAHVDPGTYSLKATAALFLPALREHVRLAAGSRTVVNMTLSTLFEAAGWLPAQRRSADEPGDDWQWTLRSTVNRPLMRLTGDDATLSTSTADSIHPSTRARMALSSGDGSFASGGTHSIFTVDRVLDDGAGMMMRADVASGLITPTADVATGYQRRGAFNSTSRLVAAYSSHPELAASAAQSGMQSLMLESAEQLQLAEFLGLDAGSLLEAVQLGGAHAVALQPFLRVTARPSDEVTITYRIATARGLQSAADMGSLDLGVPDFGVHRGHVLLQTGLHQELSLARRTGRGQIQASYYHDRITNPVVNGGGALPPALFTTTACVADPLTASFRAVGPNYTGGGVHLSATEPLGNTLWAVVEYSTGPAITSAQHFASLTQPLHPASAESATAALRGSFARTRTYMRVAYRWQPQHTLTAVDPYAAFTDQSGLSLYLRQALHIHGLLPPGTEATLDVTNLLAQGYQPIATDGDGNPIYFMQADRAIVAGLTFTF